MSYIIFLKNITSTVVYKDFSSVVGTATRELFVQFFLRIYKEIPSAKLASFSTLKYVSSQNFFKFKKYFKAEFINGFIVPAHTFDNVNGKFPIGFLIWKTDIKANKKIIITTYLRYTVCSNIPLTPI